MLSLYSYRRLRYNEAMIPAAKSPFLEKCFRLYTRRYLQRSFHAVHRLGDVPEIASEGRTPLLVCLNHSSWWDVPLGFFAATDLIGWECYGVMDERQLRRYRFFAKLGMIGVDRTGLTGAKEFLGYCERLLRGRRRALWMTPQGEMVSSRTRPIRFQPGLGHLAERLGSFCVTTIALHYEFWGERLPEAFVSLSPVVRIEAAEGDFDRKAFVHAQEQRLEAQLDTLLALVQRRDATAFQPLLQGRAGVSPTYDSLRALSARGQGARFTAEHGAVVTPPWKRKE